MPVGQGVPMDHKINIPDEYKNSFQRLIPYFSVSIHDDTQALESILLYLKIGGEKLARIAIEAYKENQRLCNAEAQKRLREAALSVDPATPPEKDDEVADDDENDDSENSDDPGKGDVSQDKVGDF